MPFTAINAHHVERDDMKIMHVRRWLDLAYNSEHVDDCATQLDAILTHVAHHPGLQLEASVDNQWQCWLKAVKFADAL